MNQDTRNKKNAKYQQNLQKRYGLTKASDYKAMCSKGIYLKENIKHMTKEFLTTSRHDKRVSREVYTINGLMKLLMHERRIMKLKKA